MTRNVAHMPIAAALVGITLLTGCQWLAPETKANRIDVESVDPETLRAEYIALRRHAERVETSGKVSDLDLAKRSAELETQLEVNRVLREELDATNADLNYLESQFISLENQLTRRETRASAVAAIADVQLLYARIRKDASGRLTDDDWDEVERRLQASDNEMVRGNYAAATYHASRAMRLMNRTEHLNATLHAQGITRVVAVASANFRQGPGSEFDVIGQVPYGTIVVELERKDRWYRIRTRSGSEGWIHTSLVR